MSKQDNNDFYQWLKLEKSFLKLEEIVFVRIGWLWCSRNKKESMKKLQAENAKLRECLEFYAVNGLAEVKVGDKIDSRLIEKFYLNGNYAREVLKELDEK